MLKGFPYYLPMSAHKAHMEGWRISAEEITRTSRDRETLWPLKSKHDAHTQRDIKTTTNKLLKPQISRSICWKSLIWRFKLASKDIRGNVASRSNNTYMTDGFPISQR